MFGSQIVFQKIFRGETAKCCPLRGVSISYFQRVGFFSEVEGPKDRSAVKPQIAEGVGECFFYKASQMAPEKCVLFKRTVRLEGSILRFQVCVFRLGKVTNCFPSFKNRISLKKHKKKSWRKTPSNRVLTQPCFTLPVTSGAY